MTRKEARDNGFKIIFEYEFQKSGAEELFALFYELNPEEKKQTEYLELLVKTALGRLGEIDALIAKNAKGWALNRISKVSLAALRCAICEMLYIDEVPANIAINEAVELAKLYEGEKAGRFVNGILASVFQSECTAGEDTAEKPALENDAAEKDSVKKEEAGNSTQEEAGAK